MNTELAKKNKMAETSIKLDDHIVEYLKKEAHHVSMRRCYDVSISDLVIESLKNTYPIPADGRFQ